MTRRRVKVSTVDGPPIRELSARATPGRPSTEVHAALVRLGLLGAPADDVVRRADRPCRARVPAAARPVRRRHRRAGDLPRASTRPGSRLGDRLLSLATHRFVGDDVAILQDRLLELGFDVGRVDGVFGARTEAALKSLQREYGLIADGSCGPAPCVPCASSAGSSSAGGRTQLRESEELHRSGASLAGKVIVIDPGHGGPDRGAVANGLEEAGVVDRTRRRLRGPARRLRRTHPADPRAGHLPDRRRPRGTGQRVRRRPARVAALRQRRFGRAERRGDVPLRDGCGDDVDRRRAPRVPRPARGGRAHRPARLPGPRQDLGDPAPDADAGRPARARATSRRLATRPGWPIRGSSTRSPTLCWCRCNGSTCRRTSTRRPAS